MRVLCSVVTGFGGALAGGECSPAGFWMCRTGAEVWWLQVEEEKVRKCWALQGQVAEETFLNLGFGCKYLS